jgi:hypothetical protein
MQIRTWQSPQLEWIRICYESKNLKDHEKKYATHDLELVAIVHALNKWRHYLMGRRFELRTDHNVLKYLFDHPTLNARQSRWLEFLCEYDFDIKHIKGKYNKVVDALNRRVHELHATTISMYQTDIKSIILEAINTNLQYGDLVEKIKQGKIPQKVENYKLETTGMLLYKNIIYVPNVQHLKLMILNEMHNVPYAGHLGYQKIVVVVKIHYFWLGMKKEIVEYFTRCMECQKVKAKHRHPASLLQPLPILECKWEVVTMEFITGFPRIEKHHDAIMVVVEKLTKASHFIPLKTNHKAADFSSIFMMEVARLHEIPKAIVFDRNTKFTSNLWKGLFKGFITHLNFSTTYHSDFVGADRVGESSNRKHIDDVCDGQTI